LVEDKRLNINQINAEERGNALHLAAKSNYLPICQILLLKDIDLTVRDANGKLAKEMTTHE
jgi:ankyrin repeat protein